MISMPAITIGTSGWNYRHWRGAFYPPGLAQREWLKHYAGTFSSVEINSTFYRLPTPDTAASWAAQTPDGFVFALKASRYITHMKKLKECDEAVTRLSEIADAVGDKLGPLLFQLPPRWRVNRERLATFLTMLPCGYRFAFEFRDRSWWTPDVYWLLRNHGIALCQFSLSGVESPDEITADFVYVRLHGPQPGYAGTYSNSMLQDWARKLLRWQRDGLSSFVYFDNDIEACAIHDARRLLNLCAQDGAR